ncbi:MAG TPA: TlpA disulfide reductase family protein [Prolixibacteraceae bacterium]|nr:TlpA disulfide reductase family protein [Prolixibacteraceae bacterium]
MKNLLLFTLLIAFFACTQTPSYKVNVKMASAEGKAYLSKRVNGDWIKLDSALLEKGEGEFKGAVSNPEICYLSVSNSKQRLPFFIENSSINIVGSVDSLPFAMVNGSAVHDEFQNLQNELDELDEKGTALFNQSKELEKAGDKVKADSIMVLAENVFASIDDLQKEYIKAHPSSWVSPYLLSRIYYDMDSEVLNGYLTALDPKLDSVPSVITLKERVNKLKTVAVGQNAPDFTMNDANGNAVKLSDVYAQNEYTLVDFWASWCGPCRRENPNVVAIYNDYKGKGLGVFGVSLDNDKAKWLKAVEDDQLSWQHVSDLKGWKNEAAAIYSVTSIPANLLIDRNGKIVGRNMYEEKLREAIEGVLK